MSKIIKIGTITKEDIYKNDRKVRREDDIANHRNVQHHRVHKSAKTYARKPKHRNHDI